MVIFDDDVKIISNQSLREVKNCNGISKKAFCSVSLFRAL